MQTTSSHEDDIEHGATPIAEPKVPSQGLLSVSGRKAKSPTPKMTFTLVVVALLLWLGWLSVKQTYGWLDSSTHAAETGVEPDRHHDPRRVHRHFRQLASLDRRFYPAATRDTDTGRARRLIIIGDVHGCKKPLSHLLDKVSLNHHTDDHVIFTGDLVAKGPSTSGVLALAHELGASSVCGNHEDAVLLKLDAYRRHHYVSSSESPFNPSAVSDLDPQALISDPKLLEYPTSDFKAQSASDRDHDRLARTLSDANIEYMASLPAILDLGGALEPFGYRRAAVVHAGLVPGIPLDAQDRYDVTRMRYMDRRTLRVSQTRADEHHHDMWPWWKVWAKWSGEHDTLVIYGHNAREGVRRGEWSIGLDSACVQGGDLTALVVDVERGMYIESVRCWPEI